MEIINGEGTIRIKDYFPLTEKMDSYLKEFYSRLFSSNSKPYSNFIKEDFADLRDNIHSYMDEKINEPPGHDNLFNDLTIVSKNYRMQGRIGEAQEFWYHVLLICHQWEQSRHQRIHKGSIFYFWSELAIIQGLLEKGFLLIHSAFEEDIQTHNTEHPGTPAELTVTLNNLDDRNLLFRLVKDWSIYLDKLIGNYRNISRNRLTLEDFRSKFLDTPPSRDTLFLFTFTLARFYDFDQFPKIAIRGDFASLYEMNVLSDMVLVIDAFIHTKLKALGSNDRSFLKFANFLLQKSGSSPNDKLNDSRLREINKAQNADFRKVMVELLDGIYTFTDNTGFSRPEGDIAIAYCIRNRSAHNVDSFPFIRERFDEIKQIIFNVLFLSVEFL